MRRGPLLLPSSLVRLLDEHALRLMQPPDGPPVDFANPAGEAALLAADSVSWRTFKNPVTVFIGGVAAVILELAEPAVRAGVWTHSSFKTDPLRRMQRTGLAAMSTVYGPASRTKAMIARVVRMHGHVTGTTEHGLPYQANDVDLLTWVHATATWGFAAAYSRYVEPLDDGALQRLYTEARPAAQLYGAANPPTDPAQMRALFARMRNRLEPSPVILEFLSIMRAAPILPAPVRRAQGLLVGAAVELIDADLRARLALDAGQGLSRWQRLLVDRIAGIAERTLLPTSPAVQSCLRLGLPRDYLYVGP